MPSSSILYHPLSSSIILFYPLLSSIILYHPLPSSIILCGFSFLRFFAFEKFPRIVELLYFCTKGGK